MFRKHKPNLLEFQLSATAFAALELFLVLLLIILGRSYLKAAPAPLPDQWTVTQYGPRDINSQFYTIANPAKGLIVVDGGWAEDADYVKETLLSLGGKVDAWIITHPHQDHAGAFVEIWKDPGKLQIDTVYTVEMASPEECLSVAPWDSVDTLRDFLELDIPDLQYVHEGDQFLVCDLTFDVLSAFGEKVLELSKDYLNDGSMMFKVTGPDKTFLFCADVGKSMSKYLLKKWGDKLKSDYVQMGHHGNGGLKKKFYKKVQPEGSFFDAPDWLMYDDTGKYDTPEKTELMESLGSVIYCFHDAPNSISLTSASDETASEESPQTEND